MKQKTLIIVACSLLIVMGCSRKLEYKNPVDPEMPPNTPVLSSPTNNATGISISPALTWIAADGAASYTLQVSTNSACTSFVYNQSGIVSISDTVTGLLYSTIYYWRVRADKNGSSSAWSSVWKYTTTTATAPIVTTSAVTNVTQATAQLNGTVNPNNDATTYYFQYGLTASYGSITATQDAGSGSSAVAVNASIGSLTAGTVYHYRIAAPNSGGTSYSNDNTFTTVPGNPNLSLPANNANGVSFNPTLSWSASTGATSYALQVSTDSLFGGSFAYNDSGLTSTSKAISGLLANTKYYWRVNAKNSFGTSGWSNIWNFTTGTPPAAPILSTPTDGATGINTNPTLSWNTSNGATSYTLQVSTSSSFSSFIYNQSGLTNTSQVIGGCVCGTLYYWRVIAYNSYGTSGWSTIWSLTTLSVTIDWISVPAGSFLMGSTATDTLNWPGTELADELPQHSINLDAYKISRNVITNGQYEYFIDGGGYADSRYWTPEGWNWRVVNNRTAPDFWYSGQYNSGPSFPYHPVVGIYWYEADAFARWLGKRLPTEAEWEKAARGTSANYWPWGNTWDASKCNSYFNVSPDTFAGTSPVGFFTAGASTYGALDMAGNVWEWVNDWYQANYYSVSPGSNPTGPTSGTLKLLRGGCYSGWQDYYCRSAKRYEFGLSAAGEGVGFRIAE